MRAGVTMSIPNMSRAIRQAGAAEIERRANRYGNQMVVQVRRIIAAKYNSARPDSRRRHPTSQRVIEGWGYKVEGDPGSFPILLTLTTEGDGEYQKRVLYLNNGTGTHTIKPRHGKKKGAKKGPFLRFPEEGDGSQPGPPWAYAKQVTHPGNKGGHFIETAHAAVMGAARRAYL